jgi:hypothetical protein
MYENQKGFALIVVALIVLVLAGAGGAGYYLVNKHSQKQTVCTMEAKICPDGSSVGRVGPNCEFSACPEVKADETVNWITYENDKYSFEIKYPSDYSLFQETNQPKEEVIPADLNSQTIFITDKLRMFFCCEPDYLTVEILDIYYDDLEKLANEEYIQPEDLETKGYIDFNGEKAYQVNDGCGFYSGGNFILVNHNLKTYYIKHDCMNLSKEIISTFKFK